jgi:hypothetical protein
MTSMLKQRGNCLPARPRTASETGNDMPHAAAYMHHQLGSTHELALSTIACPHINDQQHTKTTNNHTSAERQHMIISCEVILVGWPQNATGAPVTPIFCCHASTGQDP